MIVLSFVDLPVLQKSEQTKIIIINNVVTIKFYHHLLKKRAVHALFKITPGKQMKNN